MHPGELARFDPISQSLTGINFSQLAIGVLGVLFITGEYGTGMIRSSMAATPKRLPVLWAKGLAEHLRRFDCLCSVELWYVAAWCGCRSAGRPVVADQGPFG